MASEPKDLVLEHLKKIQGDIADMKRDMQAGFAKTDLKFDETNLKIGTLAQNMVSMRNSVDTLRTDVRMIAIAVDEHTNRLDRIEVRLGMHDA